MIIEKSKDFFDAYSENCDGIYAAGDSIETVKADALEAIRLIKKNLPEDRWPKQLKSEFEIVWKFDVPSFLGWTGAYDGHPPETTFQLSTSPCSATSEAS